MQILQLIFRALQFLFTTVVLGLSAKLVQGQLLGGVPAINAFVLFLGVFGFLIFAIGVVAVFVESLQGPIMAILDALATFFYIAGGIAMAVKLGVHDCDPKDRYAKFVIWGKDIINGGVNPPYIDDDEAANYYVGRCRIAQADTAFIYFALAAFMASLVHDLLSTRSKSRSHV